MENKGLYEQIGTRTGGDIYICLLYTSDAADD